MSQQQSTDHDDDNKDDDGPKVDMSQALGKSSGETLHARDVPDTGAALEGKSDDDEEHDDGKGDLGPSAVNRGG